MDGSSIDLEQNYTLLNDGVTYSIYALLIFAIALKFACRLQSGVRLWWDDWLILMTLIPATAAVLLYAIVLRSIIGHHIEVLPGGFYELEPFLKGFFVLSLIYVMCMVLVKFSVLALYWRLFAISARKPIIVVGVVLILWALVGIVFGILQCSPVSYYWSKTETGTCVDPKKYFMGGAIPSTVTDFAVVVLPIPYIMSLKIRLGQRLFLAGIFALGGFVTVVSIIRLVVLTQQDLTSPDVTYNLNPVATWSVVEMGLGIVAACLPSLGPLLNFLRNSSGISFRKSSNEKPSNPSGRGTDYSVISEPANASIMLEGPPDFPAFPDPSDLPPSGLSQNPVLDVESSPVSAGPQNTPATSELSMESDVVPGVIQRPGPTVTKASRPSLVSIPRHSSANAVPARLSFGSESHALSDFSISRYHSTNSVPRHSSTSSALVQSPTRSALVQSPTRPLPRQSSTSSALIQSPTNPPRRQQSATTFPRPPSFSIPRKPTNSITRPPSNFSVPRNPSVSSIPHIAAASSVPRPPSNFSVPRNPSVNSIPRIEAPGFVARPSMNFSVPRHPSSSSIPRQLPTSLDPINTSDVSRPSSQADVSRQSSSEFVSAPHSPTVISMPSSPAITTHSAARSSTRYHSFRGDVFNHDVSRMIYIDMEAAYDSDVIY